MSLLWLFRKFVDPIEHRQQEIDRKRQREARPAAVAAEPDGHYRCRVCEYESSSDEYCPRCLADTMEEVEDPRSGEAHRDP